MVGGKDVALPRAIIFHHFISHSTASNHILTVSSGVAVGSSIGHAIGGFFSGDSAPATAEAAAVANTQAAPEQNNWQARNCDIDAKQFTKCLDENQGNMQTCSWYLEQLKACQAAAANY